MTAGELIAFLQKFPANTRLLTSICSDMVEVEEPVMKKAFPDTRDRRWSSGMPAWLEYHERQWPRKPPVHVEDVLYFDGN